jgi:hypothetical protein
MVECAFYILANKWRIFHRPLNVMPPFCCSKGLCILHSYICQNDGFQPGDALYESDFESFQAKGTHRNTKGKHVRDYFAKYFTSPCRAVLWQYDKV